MMKKSSRMLIGILIFAIIILGSSVVQAANQITIIGGNNTTVENTQNTPVIVGGNNTVTENKVVNTSTSYNTTTNKDQATLPQTGESDIYVVVALVVICTISAIYTYKKIRDYNID